MKKRWQSLLCACIFLTVFLFGGTPKVEAEAKAIDRLPAAGVYLRKTASGIPNGRIDVIVKDYHDGQAALVGVESRNYEGNSYDGSDMAPRIYIAGCLDASRVVLSYGYTDKRTPAPDPRLLPLMTCVVYNAEVRNNAITLTPQMFDKTRAIRTDPDLAGTYVYENPYSSPSAFMAIAWVRQQNPQLTGLEPGLDYRYEDNFVADGMEKNYPGIGQIKPSYELKAYDGNSLVRTFLVSRDFSQIYVIRPDGEALLIYNSEGGVG